MAWRVAKSLDTLLAQLNSAAPKRKKVSDGSIGDAAHASRDSDHNPWLKLSGVGIVTARDFTNDPAGGLDCNKLAAALVASDDPRIKYLIWNRRIYTPGRGWAAYKGTNPHDEHLHLSVSEQPGWFDSTRPWDLGRQLVGSPVTTLPVDHRPPVAPTLTPEQIEENDLMSKADDILTELATLRSEVKDLRSQVDRSGVQVVQSDPNQGGTGAMAITNGQGYWFPIESGAYWELYAGRGWTPRAFQALAGNEFAHREYMNTRAEVNDDATLAAVGKLSEDEARRAAERITTSPAG